LWGSLLAGLVGDASIDAHRVKEETSTYNLNDDSGAREESTCSKGLKGEEFDPALDELLHEEISIKDEEVDLLESDASNDDASDWERDDPFGTDGQYFYRAFRNAHLVETPQKKNKSFSAIYQRRKCLYPYAYVHRVLTFTTHTKAVAAIFLVIFIRDSSSQHTPRN